MATGPEHYIRTEQLLREVRDGHQEGTDVAAILAAAQAHATLALTAATEAADIPRGKVLVDQCRTGESAYGRQCIKAEGHSTGHDFGDGSDEDDEDRGCIEDAHSASELHEMDRDLEYRLDAEDDARNTAEYEADQRDGA